jgi:hypothetical protein
MVSKKKEPLKKIELLLIIIVGSFITVSLMARMLPKFGTYLRSLQGGLVGGACSCGGCKEVCHEVGQEEVCNIVCTCSSGCSNAGADCTDNVGGNICTQTTPPTYTNFGTNNTNPSVGNDVKFYSQWNDNVQLDKYIFSWNAKGIGCSEWENFTSNFQAANWTNTTKTIPSTCGGKTISYKFYANDTSNNWAATNEKTITVATADTPKGNLEYASCDIFAGWTCDSTDYSTAIDVYFYKDGEIGTGTPLGSTIANKQREQAVGDSCGGNRNHGFVFITPNSVKDNQQHTIYAYANDIPSGNKVQLSGSPKTLTCPPPGCCPHVNIQVPSSVPVNTQFTVNLTYTHDTSGNKGGIHIHWDSTKADYISSVGCIQYSGSFQQGNIVVETDGWKTSGSTCNVTLKAKVAGSLELKYRAWDWTINSTCPDSPSGYNRDPSSGTCSSNCDTFPDEAVTCDNKTATVTVAGGDTVPPTYTNFGTNNTNPSVGNDVKFYSQWSDNVQLSKYIFSWNASSTWENFTSNFQAGNWTNTTKTMLSAYAGKVIGYKFYGNDTSNNWAATTEKTITVAGADTTPPIVTIESPLNQTYTTTPVWANVTLDEAGSWCGRSLDGGANVTMSSDSTTHFYNQITGLSLGAHNVRFYCNDTAGNMNGSVLNRVYFTLAAADTTPPTYTNFNTNNTNPSTDNDVKFYSQWNDNVQLSKYIFSWNAYGTNCNEWHNYTESIFQTGNWTNTTKTIPTTNPSTCGGKTISYKFYANDTSNNWAATTTNTITVAGADTTPPIVTIQSPLNQSYVATSVWANVTLDEAGSWCGVSLDSGANQTMTNSTGNWNYKSNPLFLGAHNVRFYCNDTAGNMNGSVANKVYFTLAAADTTPPRYFSNSTDSTLAGSLIKFSLKWTDNVALSGFIFSFDNCTSSFVNSSWSAMTGTTNWSNVSKIINSTPYCMIRWRVYANDTSNNWNASEIFSFRTTSSDTTPLGQFPFFFADKTVQPVAPKLGWTIDKPALDDVTSALSGVPDASVSAVKNDTDVMDSSLNWNSGYTTQYIITVGGPVNNNVSKKYNNSQALVYFNVTDSSFRTSTGHKYVNPNENSGQWLAFVSLFPDPFYPTRWIMLVTGRTGNGTKAAGTLLKNYQNHKSLLTGYAVVLNFTDTDHDNVWEEDEGVVALENINQLPSDVISMSDLSCNSQRCSFNINMNILGEPGAIFVYLYSSTTGTVYYSGTANPTIGYTGGINAFLTTNKDCPSGTHLRTVAFAYKHSEILSSQENPTRYGRIAPRDAFTC